MTPERWRRVREVFDEAAELPSDKRTAFVALACGSDRELAVEVENMLRAPESLPGVRAAIAAEADLLAGAAVTAATGKRLGRYRLVEELGAGGMGTVYLAERVDDEYRTRVAVKILARGLKTQLAVARFRDERQILAELEHPNIVRLLDGGTEDDLPYLVMERLDGVPITRHAVQHDLPVRARLELFVKVCDALQYAHEKLVVHRDIKPSNILVDAGGTPKLLDFGIAKLMSETAEREARTDTGMAPFTLGYASPEQVRGRPISTATDIYSLGAVLYELLADTPAHPLPTGDAVARLHMITEVDPPRPSTVAPAGRRAALAGDLDTIVLKALHKDPARRYRSVEGLAEDLRRHLGGRPVLARPGTWLYRARKFVRRNRAPMGVAAFLLTALAVVGVVAYRRTAAVEARARLTNQTTQEVKEIEWLLRTAYLLPPHDVSPEEEHLRQRMAEIGRRAGGGALADYAIGRGHLALHEYDLALASLDRAVAGGLRTPELEYARGLTLGRIYQRESAELRNDNDAEGVAARKRELEERYLKPALAALEGSRGVWLESATYLDGVIAFYRGDYETAMQRARAVQAETPWLYPAIQLEADAVLNRGLTRPHQDEAAAFADVDEAARLYDKALDAGRSDVNLYVLRMEIWNQQIMVRRFRRLDHPPDLAPVEEWCRLAAIIAPRDPMPFVKLSYARGYVGRFFADWGGGDPMPYWESAVEAARRAQALDDQLMVGHLLVGAMRARQAWWTLGHGGDPRAYIDDCIREYQRAAQLDPKDPKAVDGVSVAYTRLGSYLESIGEDPTENFRKAIDQTVAALRINPRFATGFGHQVAIYRDWIEYLVEHGRDPQPVLEPYLAAEAACVRTTHASCLLDASVVHDLLARYDLERGRDPTRELDRAEALIGKEDGGLMGRHARARMRLVRLLAAVASGGDVRAAAGALAAAVASCQAMDARDAVCAKLEAEGALITAQSKRELERARELAARAVELDPGVLQEALAAEAELKLGHVDAGLAACERGLAVNPHDARLLGARGALLLRRALATRDPAVAREAREVFAQAFAQNPLLARRYQLPWVR